MSFVRFPNGKVWQVGEHATIEGTVQVPDLMSHFDLESLLDAISDAATGSVVGLTGFSYECRGKDVVWFRGTAEELPDLEDEDECKVSGYKPLTTDSAELREALAEQYGLDEVEVAHALASLDISDRYDDECVINIAGSHRQIRTPAHPAECNYVRVVVDGIEVAYWVDDEWRDDPAIVMGALMGAAAAKAGG